MKEKNMHRICGIYRLLLLISSSILPLCLTGQSGSTASLTNEAFMEGLNYRFVGPTRGGRSTAVTGVPGKPFTFLMGTTGGGIWRTDDAGMNWSNLSDGQIEAGSIGAVTIAPSDPAVIYAGTGSACPRGNVSAGIGLYKSDDGGKTWKHSGLTKAGQIGKILVHPDDPDLVYVAALGNIFGKNAERGLYRSRDGGSNWEKVLFISDSTGVVDLAMNPENPREIYAAAWRAERKPWTLIDGGPEGGIFKSTDGGDHWEKLENGLPSGLLGRIGLAVSPARPDRVWALIIAPEEEDAGLYRSDDAGKSWRRICRNHELRQRGWYYTHLTADPQDENTLYVNNVRLWKSIDGGKTFDERIYTPHSDHHGLWINPENPEIMINCNDGGACISLNGGRTWSTQLNQPTSEFYRLTVDGQFPYRLYAGQQDNTTISVPSHDPGGITTTQHWHSIGGGECADVGVNPNNPNIVWATSYSGEITITNLETGYERQVTAYPHYTEGTQQRDLKYRFQWNAPVLVSAHDPNTVYYTSNYVHRTTNDGQSWEIISPDLTRKIDEYQDIPGGPIQHDATGVEVYSSIFAFEESPFHEGELWAGTDDGRLHLSRDGGDSWEEITPEGMPFEGTVNKIELSTHAPGRAFVAVYNYRYNDFQPYLFSTDDYGRTWNLLTDGSNGIPGHHFIRTVAEDPERRGLLYAGTEFGMYFSYDDGASWRPFQLNLPHTPVTDMEVHRGDLVLSTQGRGYWILDDLTPLHQLDPDVLQSDLHLFRPRAAYRTNVDGYDARIHCFFKEKPADPAVLEVLNEQGVVVRRYSTDTDRKMDQIKVKSGLNTFTWDLKHQGPDLVENLVAMVIRNPAPGPPAAPGTYTIRLRSGETEQQTSLEVLPDPRWPEVTRADYLAQTELALEIRNLLTESHNRIKNLRAIRQQIQGIADKAQKAGYDSSIQEMAKNLSEQLSAVEDQIIQNKSEAGQDNINYPRVFTNHLGRLYSVVTRDYDRPTGGALERYEDLKKEYAGILSSYRQVVQEELPKFNALLEKHQVQRIIIPEKL